MVRLCPIPPLRPLTVVPHKITAKTSPDPPLAFKRTFTPAAAPFRARSTTGSLSSSDVRVPGSDGAGVPLHLTLPTDPSVPRAPSAASFGLLPAACPGTHSVSFSAGIRRVSMMNSRADVGKYGIFMRQICHANVFRIKFLRRESCFRRGAVFIGFSVRAPKGRAAAVSAGRAEPFRFHGDRDACDRSSVDRPVDECHLC